MAPLRGVCVCVDYSDIFSMTYPYNSHHFSDFLIITSPHDLKTIHFCDMMSVKVFQTDLFYRDGARFNKWLALEEGLNHFGREGWMCLLDADVLWPRNASRALDRLQHGYLYTPRRRMYPTLPKNEDCIPHESLWANYPTHRNENEFAGYTQIFNASDPVLGNPPWHETDWIHAGGADSFFQLKWPDHLKIRPAFEVLHLGEAGVNWLGRTTAYADGTMPIGAAQKRRELHTMLSQRRTARRASEKFNHEKIKKPVS